MIKRWLLSRTPKQLRALELALLTLMVVLGGTIVARDAGVLKARFFVLSGVIVGVFAAFAWASSAYYAGEKMRAAEEDKAGIEAMSNAMNFIAALLTALATILQAAPSLFG